MKKEYKVWLLGMFAVFCLFASQKALAESIIIPSTDTINQYLKYRSGCRSSLVDCYNANSLEGVVANDIRGILSKFSKPETQIEKIEKAREQFRKDNEADYKRLQDEIKNRSSATDTQIATGFYCVYPTQTCTEHTYESIRGIAISSGLTPDPDQLAACRAKIDEYNQELQEYNQCQADWIAQKARDMAQEEYDHQLFLQKMDLLENNLSCKDKEGPYSSYDKNAKQCACVDGATFISGWCHSNTQIQIDNFLGCVKSYGINSKYDPSKDVCKCQDNATLDLQKGVCVLKTEVLPKDEPSSPYGRYADLVPAPSIKKSNFWIKTTQENSVTEKEGGVVSEPAALQETVSEQKPTFWQRVKVKLLKIKFW